MQIFVNILIMAVILGVLISIHEAGHLSMAKLFKVYCFEYSIGMGPKILRVKRKKGETYFAIRAIPFGGYVSMYGEAGAVPDGVTPPPPERALNGIARWKRIIIMVAGVVLNFLLGLILIFLSVSCFEQYYYGYGAKFVSADNEDISLQAAFCYATYQEDSAIYNDLTSVKDPELTVDDYVFFEGSNQYLIPSNGNWSLGSSSYGTIVDSSVTLADKDGKVQTATNSQNEKVSTFVALYTPSVLTSDHLLSDYIYLYPSLGSVDSLLAGNDDLIALYKGIGVENFPDVSVSYFDPSDKVDDYYSYDLDMTAMPLIYTQNEDGEKSLDLASSYAKKITLTEKVGVAGGKWSNPGLNLKVVSAYNGWDKAWVEWADYVPYCCTAIAEGIFGLFTPSGWSNLSGIVGMTAAVGTVSAMGGAASIFLYAGAISINLAFFNLLPFPGLDGWQILVTLVEGGVNVVKKSKWKKNKKEEGQQAEQQAAVEAYAAPSAPVETTTESAGSVLVKEESSTTVETEKKPDVYQEWHIPAKISGIISYVGLGLLILLMVVIMVKDIIGLF